MKPGKIYSTAIIFVLLVPALFSSLGLANTPQDHINIVVHSDHTASLEASGILSPVVHPYTKSTVDLDFGESGDDLFIILARNELYNSSEKPPPDVATLLMKSETSWSLDYFYDGKNLVVQTSQTQVSWNSLNRLTLKASRKVRLILSENTGILRAKVLVEVETVSATFIDVLAKLAELYRSLNTSEWFRLLELEEQNGARDGLLYGVLKTSFLVDLERRGATPSPEGFIKVPASSWAKGRCTISAIEKYAEKVTMYTHTGLRRVWTEKNLTVTGLGDGEAIITIYDALDLAWNVVVLSSTFSERQSLLLGRSKPGLLELTMLAGFLSEPQLRGASGQLRANVSGGEIVYELQVRGLPIPSTSTASDTRLTAQRLAELVVVLMRLTQDPEPLAETIMDRTVTLEPGDLGVADISPRTVKFRDLYAVSIQWAEETQETTTQPPVTVGENLASTQRGFFLQAALTAALLAVAVTAALAVAWLGTARRKDPHEQRGKLA